MANDPGEETMDAEMDLGSPKVANTVEETGGEEAFHRGRPYRDTLQQNNPNLTFDIGDNLIWVEGSCDYVSEDDERILREPWRNALIIHMFDKGIRYLRLKRNLKAKWALKGDFSLIDIGCDYYVTRFSNLEDYDHVMMNGPWMIGDNYLVIREWVPNFVPEEDTIEKLTAWEGATYGSWMLVRKQARRRNTRQQQQPGNRDGDHAGPNRSSHDENPTRTVTVRERNPNQERRNSEAGNNTVGNLGSRFRALTEIDLNVDMATNNGDDPSPENGEHNFQKESNHIIEESLEANNMDNIRQINGARYQEDRENIPPVLNNVQMSHGNEVQSNEAYMGSRLKTPNDARDNFGRQNNVNPRPNIRQTMSANGPLPAS
ncbi:hypothetical protein Cgig2_026639 [Carnegiea gigantea]|uniref:DUF4283 domain-containing protein n=1 Tax=Carnegiea gigantea TaxID=171969 RepID=A0A9Q1K4V1_9CARY|nr:hypothetical protein Cgig2_026639 [Carnegiea gigantea]